MNIRQRYNPILMGADASQDISGTSISGFLPKTAGTITVTGKDASGNNAVTLVDAVPVAAGVYCQIPLAFPSPEGRVTLGGGASGTLFV